MNHPFPSLRLALPWRTRARLWVVRCIDLLCCHLVERGHDRAAIGVWRACGLWH